MLGSCLACVLSAQCVFLVYVFSVLSVLSVLSALSVCVCEEWRDTRRIKRESKQGVEEEHFGSRRETRYLHPECTFHLWASGTSFTNRARFCAAEEDPRYDHIQQHNAPSWTRAIVNVKVNGLMSFVVLCEQNSFLSRACFSRYVSPQSFYLHV